MSQPQTDFPDFPTSASPAIYKLVEIGPLNLMSRKREAFQAAWVLTGYAGGRVFTDAPATEEGAVLRQFAKLSREEGFALLQRIVADGSGDKQKLSLLDFLSEEKARQLAHWAIDLLLDLGF